MQSSIIIIVHREWEIRVSVYLPGPAVGLGVHSVDHTGGQQLNGMGASREGYGG